MTVTQTNTTPIANALDPPPEPGRDLPSPSRPLPGIPKPGDLPAQPRPGDPPPSEPKPGSPGPIRPQTVATFLLLLVLLPAMGLAQPAEDAIDDNDILEAVESDLRFDDAIAADSVDVTVDARWQPKPDEAIEEDAARRLRWSPFLDVDQITVTVDDGVVTLRGTVDSWQERKTAGRQVYQAGARRVINELDVRSRQ